MLTFELRSKWSQQILEAVVIIHSHSVIHPDLALRRLFIDDNLDLRLGDFNSSQCPGLKFDDPDIIKGQIRR